jgi:tetratricopeptide (TPR) repeat protein
MQWADQATNSFIAFLCDRLDMLPVFVCLAQRPQDDYIEPKWLSHPKHIVLDPLGCEGTRELLTSLFNTADIPQNFCDEIFELSGGNPFVVLEIAKALFSNKAIAWGKNKWVYEANSEALPAEVSMAISLRVELLSESEQQVLNYAAVINRPFEFDLLAAVLDVSSAELYEQLERLVHYHFLRKNAEDHYCVFHSLIAQTVYQHLSLREKEVLHLKLAQCLVDVYQKDGMASEIAHHFLQAGCDHDAWPFLVQAGDQACIAYSFFEAKKIYDQVLGIIKSLHKLTSDTYLNILCKYIDALRWLMDWDGIKKNVLGIIDNQELPPYYYGILVSSLAAPLLVEGNLKEAEKLLKNALQNLNDPQYDLVKISLYLCRAQVCWANGQYEKATQFNTDAVGICQNLPQPFYRVFGDYILGHDHLTNSRFGASEIAFSKALTEYETVLKDKRYTNLCRAALREIYTYRGHFLKAEEFSQQIIDNANNAGIKSLAMYEMVDLGYIYFEQDKLDEAESCYLRVIELYKQVGDNHKLCLAYVRLAELYHKLDDLDKSLVYALDAEKIKSPNLTRQSQVYRALGKVYAALGNTNKAKGYFEKSKDVLETVQGFHFALALFESGTFYFESGQQEIAKTQVGQALDMFKKMGATHFLKKAQKVWDRIEDKKTAKITVKKQPQTDQIMDTTQLLNEAIDRLLQLTL